MEREHGREVVGRKIHREHRSRAREDEAKRMTMVPDSNDVDNDNNPDDDGDKKVNSKRTKETSDETEIPGEQAEAGEGGGAWDAKQADEEERKEERPMNDEHTVRFLSTTNQPKKYKINKSKHDKIIIGRNEMDEKSTEKEDHETMSEKKRLKRKNKQDRTGIGRNRNRATYRKGMFLSCDNFGSLQME